MQNIIVCFNESYENQVRLYLQSRDIKSEELYFNITLVEEQLNKAGEQQVFLLLFDFINEPKFYSLYKKYESKVKKMQIITPIIGVANQYKDENCNIFVPSALLDATLLFWDSKAFEYDNLIRLEKAGYKPLSTRKINVTGLKIDKLTLNFTLKFKVVNKIKLHIIDIVPKAKGKSIYSESLTLGEKLTKLVDKLLKRVDIAWESIFKGIKDNESKIDISDTIDNSEELDTTDIIEIAKSIDKNISKSMIDYLLENKFIIDTQASILKESEIKFNSKFKLIDYIVDKYWITEDQGVKACVDYYNMSLCYRSRINNMPILLNIWSLERCIKYKCFITTSDKQGAVCVVIDPDNEMTKSIIPKEWEQFYFIYTREQFIMDRLQAEQEKRNITLDFDILEEDLKTEEKFKESVEIPIVSKEIIEQKEEKEDNPDGIENLQKKMQEELLKMYGGSLNE